MSAVGPRAVAWDLGVLPLQIGHQPSPTNSPLPDTLPFVLRVDEQTGLVTQQHDQGVSNTLAEAYRIGSQMGTPLTAEGIGSAQLADVRAFIEESLPDRDLQGLNVLEIGCGDGTLLEQLSHQGARVCGVEPGLTAATAARARRLPVHAEPFRASRFDGQRFDLIVHHTVLEHIEKPVEFVADQLRLLSPAGRIVCCVPDCAPALEHGDLSMLVHEHWNYFDVPRLIELGTAAGAQTVAWRRATSEGAIYCVWTRGLSNKQQSGPSPVSYIERAKRTLADTKAFLAEGPSARTILGIFPAARWINYQALLERTLPVTPKMRWFDDDPALHGRFYPPVTRAVESREELLAKPVERLLIASWTFGQSMREELAREPALAGTTIHTLGELFKGGVAA